MLDVKETSHLTVVRNIFHRPRTFTSMCIQNKVFYFFMDFVLVKLPANYCESCFLVQTNICFDNNYSLFPIH